MKKSSEVILIFLSSVALASCGKTNNQSEKHLNKDQDWTVQSSTNNEDSVRFYQHRTGGYWLMYPFIWHNLNRQRFGSTGKYAPSYFSKKGGFTVGNRSITRGGFGTTSKGGST